MKLVKNSLMLFSFLLQLTPRPSRYADQYSPLASSDIDLKALVSETLANFSALFDEEQSNSSDYKECWQEAATKYESIFQSLNKKDKNFLSSELPSKLPGQLQDKSHFLAIAVIANSLEDGRLAETFLSSTRALQCKDISWESFGLKTFLALLTLALEHLPSKPGPELNRVVFRGLDCDSMLEVGQTFSLGYFASFSPRRMLGLGKQVKHC